MSTPEHRRRSCEGPKISEAHERLIRSLDKDPDREFRRLEDKGYKIPDRAARVRRDLWD